MTDQIDKLEYGFIESSHSLQAIVDLLYIAAVERKLDLAQLQETTFPAIMNTCLNEAAKCSDAFNELMDLCRTQQRLITEMKEAQS